MRRAGSLDLGQKPLWLESRVNLYADNGQTSTDNKNPDHPTAQVKYEYGAHFFEQHGWTQCHQSRDYRHE